MENINNKTLVSINKFLWRAIKKRKFHMLTLMFLAFIKLFFFSFISNNITTKIIDLILENNFSYKTKGATFYLVLLILCSIVAEISVFLFNYMCLNFFPKIESEVRMDLFVHSQNLSCDYIKNTSEGFIENCINSTAEGCEEFLTSLISRIIPGMLVLIYGIIFLFQLKFQLGAITCLWILISIFFQLILSKKTFIYTKQCTQTSNKRSASFIDSLKNIFITKMLKIKDFIIDKNGQIQEKEVLFTKKYLFRSAFSNLISGVLSVVFQALVFLFIVSKLGIINLSTMVKIININFWIIYIVWDRTRELVESIESYGQASQSLRDLFKAPLEETIGTRSMDVIKGSIVVKNLNFSFGEKNIFNNFNLEIKPKEKVVLLGPSGVGKTTFFSFLTKMTLLKNESIYIDEVGLNTIDTNSLRDNITYISQSNMVFNSTIRENIMIGNLQASQENMIEVAKLAKIHDVIEKLPNKYDNLVGNSSFSLLSGGQIQRICIARALLHMKNRNSGIVLCDEATSALDVFCAKSVIKNILEVCKEETVIFIDHSKYIAPLVDKVVFINSSNKVYVGSHTELIQNNPTYQELFN